MEKLFFTGWDGLIRTALIGVLAYISLVVLLRISGKRTLSKMNAFDLVVTVALGSTLATILLNKNVAFAEGVLAFALLIGLQFIVTWSSVRVRWVRKFVTGEPRMLFYQGKLLPQAMKAARVTESELRAAVRSAGCSNMEDIEAVVLETDASFSIVRQRENGEGASSLADLQNPPREFDTA